MATHSSKSHATTKKESTKRNPVTRSNQATAATQPSVAVQRAVTEPASAQPAEVLRLQRQYGNRAVQRLMATRSVQAKLKVGPAGDAYEQEADRVAAQVMTMPATPSTQRGAAVQRQDEAGAIQAQPLAAGITPLVQRQEDEDEIQTKPLTGAITPLVQRQEDEDEIQTKRDDPRASFEAGKTVEAQLQAQKGSGSPMPAEVRAYMEPRFGTDFSGVRLHTGSQAAQLSRDLSAQAFTHGQDIYLGADHTDVQNPGGQRLLAHELAHVVQQTGGGAGVQRQDKRIQRRLALTGTDWTKTYTMKGSTSGATGVLFMGDQPYQDPPADLVVKTGVNLEAELMFAGIHEALGQDNKAQEWNLQGIATRAATDEDKTAIQNRFQVLKERNIVKSTDTRAETLVGRINPANTMIQQAGKGEEYGKLLASGGAKGHMEKGKWGQWKIKKDSALKPLTSDFTFAYTLGRLAAADIFFGNYDRLMGKLNLTNLLVDMRNKKVTPIDNADPTSSIQMGGENFNLTRDLKSWREDVRVQAFLANNFQALAKAVWSTNYSKDTGGLQDAMAELQDVSVPGDLATGSLPLKEGETNKDRKFFVNRQLSKKKNERDVIKAKMEKHHDAIVARFAEGLAEGKATIKRTATRPGNTPLVQQYNERLNYLKAH